jgi:release factor glutamine methyltransferase
LTVGNPTPSVAQAIHAAAERLQAVSGDARLEADVLLAHVLQIDRAHLLARLALPIEPETRTRVDALVERRLAREPLAYIVGRREFYGIDIACAPGSLIPRPETEMLVDAALGEIRTRGTSLRVVDVGTGSGAIAIAIAMNAPATHLLAVDSSAQALTIARRNAERLGVAERIDFRQADLLVGAGEFDVILANLPYVSESDWTELPPEIRDYEPREALVGGETGAEVVDRLVASAPTHLRAGGVLAAEIGAGQGRGMSDLARACFPAAEVWVKKDLAGLDRMLLIRRPGG